MEAINKPLDPMSVERTDTPSAAYVLRQRYGSARHAITVASWVTAVSMLLQPVAVLAATRNWDGDISTAWGTAGNWDTAPVSDLTTDLANFNNIGPYQAASTPRHPNAGTVSIKGITIGASNGAMTLSGTALSIGANGITIDSGAGAIAISSPITLGESQTWANNSANTLTVSGNIAGGAGLVVVVHPIAGINLPDTAIAATATSTLDLAASTKDHILGNVNVTAGATLTVDNANKLTMGTLTIGINGANCGKLNLGTKELILGNGSVTKLAVTSTSPTVQAYCVAEAKAWSFTTLNGTSVTDDTGKKWNVEVRVADGTTVDANGLQLWLVTQPPAAR